MILFEGLESLPLPFAASTVAIGTFDGIHVGHQAIISAAVRDAERFKRPSVVFTFDRHPADLLAPDRAPGYLTTPEQRNACIAELGVESLVVATFDRSLAGLAPDAFVEDILVGALGAKTIVVGDNFAFGRGRSGDVAFLDAAQSRYGFQLISLQPVEVVGSPASSTRVRQLLGAGEVAEAELVLGHPFWLSGTVVEGQKLGRQLGYPTANLEPRFRQVVPCDGVYAVRVRLDDGRVIGGACSIGNRPTVEGAGRSIETYLLDFDEDLYGRRIDIRFVRRLRAEARYDSLDALTTQIAEDVRLARAVLDSATQ